MTSQLLINIFEKNTPLHDGAVILQGTNVAAATCYLPLSANNEINKDLGTRHRAAIGLSEETDSWIVVVSEETGSVSLARGGQLLHDLTPDALREELQKIENDFSSDLLLQEVEKRRSRRRRPRGAAPETRPAEVTENSGKGEQDAEEITE